MPEKYYFTEEIYTIPFPFATRPFQEFKVTFD